MWIRRLPKKIEIKLTGIAKGSLMELQRDYQKFLQHRELPEWLPSHPALARFKSLRCATLEQFRAWVADETRQYEKACAREKRNTEEKKTEGQEKSTDKHGRTRTVSVEGSGVRGGPCKSVSSTTFPAVCAANGALALLNVCVYLVGRQMEAQAAAFEREGGFTERLYRTRARRRSQP